MDHYADDWAELIRAFIIGPCVYNEAASGQEDPVRPPSLAVLCERFWTLSVRPMRDGVRRHSRVRIFRVLLCGLAG